MQVLVSGTVLGRCGLGSLRRERTDNMLFVAIALVATIIVSSAAFVPAANSQLGAGGHSSVGHQQVMGQAQLKKFSSYEELENFVKKNLEIIRCYHDFRPGGIGVPLGLGVVESAEKNESLPNFSGTNIQVEGVDEADIVKSDGKCIYVVSGNRVIMIDAYPPESARILSEIEENGSPTEIFINGDKLVVFGQTFVRVYDISDREEPILKRDISFNGSYFDSRMIGDYVYVIVISPPIHYLYAWEESLDSYVGIKNRIAEVKFEITLPKISIDGDVRTIQASEIYYFDVPDYSYEFTTIMAINTQDDDEEITTETILMGTAHNIFVSPNNIYITYTRPSIDENGDWTEKTTVQKIAVTEKTTVHKIGIANGEIEHKSQGEVPGRVLNQFSMDEYRGYFRIATTTGWSDQNHVYILDEDLNIAGKLEGLAPGERIYSARFMGGRAYLVTFKQVDPLFVLDLSNPRDPKVLGKLKIPGYSDYLHPYDETHIIGVGREAGVKIALFDVSDPENPREISKYVVGDQSIVSYALDDHRAFLFSRSKNILVMPIGYYFQQEAHVFNVSLDDGIVLKGTIAHMGSDENWPHKSHDEFNCVYSWYHRDYSVKRSLYIDNVLYTISDALMKMNSLDDLSEVGWVEFGNNFMSKHDFTLQEW